MEDSSEVAEDEAPEDVVGDRLSWEPVGLVLSRRRGGRWDMRDLTVSCEADLDDPSVEKMESLGRVDEEVSGAAAADSCRAWPGLRLRFAIRLPN